MVARASRTPALFSALGHFGRPGVWAFLTRQLANEIVAPAAEDTLVTLLGQRVAPDAENRAMAWRDTIQARALDPAARYRRGEVWRPRVVADGRSRVEIEACIDELVVRARVDAPIDLVLWTTEAQPALSALCAAAQKRDASWPASGW